MKQENLIPLDCSWHAAVDTPAYQQIARCFPASGVCPGIDQCNRDLANRIRYVNKSLEKKK